MRKGLTGVFASVLVLALAVPVVVIAQEDGATDSSSGLVADETTDQATDRQARIDAYKQRVTDRLTAAQERRITNACAAAQGKITSLNNNLNAAIERRRGVYADISAKLATVVEKLQAASVDTAELEAAIVEMESQAAAVVAAAEEYHATLDDLAAMDCTADPEGFQAALTVAREQRANTITQATALKDYVNNTIKTILQNIRTQIAAGAEES